MKVYIFRLFASLTALFFISTSLYALLRYMKPLDDQFYDLSMFGSEQEMIEEWDRDTKGWAVFVQEGEMRHELDAVGWGSYNGLDHPGQTAYASRTMTEEVSSPTLRLYTANRAVVVFLDDEVLYTDCPQQDNRVGYLALSAFDWDREPLIITLPPDYPGRTLTVAQSTPEIPESPSAQVTLCGVELYCSYAAESILISESFRTALPAILVFLLGTASMMALLWQGFHGRWDMGLAALAITALSLTLALLNQTSFSYNYFGETPADLNALCRAASLSALLAFLGQRGGRHKWLLWILASLHGGLALLGRGYAFSQLTTFSELAGCAGLLATCILSLIWRRERRHFYKLFTPLYLSMLFLAVAGTAVYGLFAPVWGRYILLQLQLSMQNGLYRFFLWKWAVLTLIASAMIATIEIIRQEDERRTETRLLLQRGALAQENYENLRRHNEEIAILRHDLRHHLTVLQNLCQEKDYDHVRAYLDTMGAWNTMPGDYTVHPFVNGILTVMLARGSRLGIRSEVRVQLPEQLTIPDNDLCALLMNLLENALEANEKVPKEKDRWMKVAMHIRDSYLYIGVENARFEPVDFDQAEGVFRSTKEGAFHGYGLKSARTVARKYKSKLRLEALDGRFSSSTALLLPPS